MLMILLQGKNGMKSTKSDPTIDKKETITCARVTLGVDLPHNFMLFPWSFINSSCVIRSLPLDGTKVHLCTLTKQLHKMNN